jgi:hypothetical protein
MFAKENMVKKNKILKDRIKWQMEKAKEFQKCFDPDGKESSLPEL